MNLSTPSVVWSQGIHLTGTPLWCDALSPSGICFISYAGAIKSRQHTVLATQTTLSLLRKTKRDNALVSPFLQPFSLGALELELIPSGYTLGSSSLLIHHNDETILYAGRVGQHSSDLFESTEVRSCDVVIIDIPYADLTYRVPSPKQIIKKIQTHVQESRKQNKVPLFLVSSLIRGIEVAYALKDNCVRVGSSIFQALQNISEYTDGLIVKRLSSAVKAGDVVVAIINNALPWLVENEPVYLPMWICDDALNYQRALERHHDIPVFDESIDTRFQDVLASIPLLPWCDGADSDYLHHYIETCHAKQVFVTGRGANAFVQHYVDNDAITVTPMMSTQQLPLLST